MDHQPQSASWWSSGPQKFERCTSSYSSNHQQDLSGSFTSVKDPPQIQDKMDRKLTKLGVSTLLLSTVLFFMAGLPTPKKTKLIAQCSNPFDIEWNPGLIRDGILISWLYEIIPTAYVAPDPCFITCTHSQQRRSTGHCSIIKLHSLKLNKTALKTKTSHPKRTFHLPTHWFSRSQLAIISFWEGVFAMVLLHPRSLTAHPWNWMVGRRSFPFWDGNFLGANCQTSGGDDSWNPRWSSCNIFCAFWIVSFFQPDKKMASQLEFNHLTRLWM